MKLEAGLYARPAVKLIETAAGHRAKIILVKNGKTVRTDSITAILVACIMPGDQLAVRAEGPDEESAIQAREQFFA